MRTSRSAILFRLSDTSVPGRVAAAERQPRRRVTIASIVAAYVGASLWLNVAYPGPFKALTYAIPFFALMAMLSESRFTLPANAAPYLVLMLAGIGLAPLNSLVGWQDLYLMLMGLSPFFFGYRYRWTWRQVFIATVLATVLSIIASHRHGGLQFNVLESKSSFESPTSFVFGLLALWAAMDRRWRLVLLALLMCVLTLKRIIVIATVITIIVMLLPAWFSSRLLRPAPMVLLNAIVLVFVVLYTKGHFDQWIHAWSQQSANQLGMGRQALYRQPVEELVRHPVQYMFYGVGPGGIYEVIKRGFAFFGKPNLHNDSLKILVEYGGIVWLAFFAALYRDQPLRARYVMLFSNIVLLTDNSLIYPYFIFTMGLVLHNVLPTEQNLQDRATVIDGSSRGARRRIFAKLRESPLPSSRVGP